MSRPNYQHPLHKNDLFPIFLTKLLKIQVSFATQVQESENGKEVRRPKRTTPIRRYAICKHEIEKNEFNKLSDFFHDKAGGLYSFLLLDLYNFTATDQILMPYPENSQNPDDEASLQYKYFLAQNFTNILAAQNSTYLVQRIIKTPEIDSIKLSSYNGGVLYNEETGAIEVSTKLDKNTKADFKFYTPVRFENDTLEYSGHSSPNHVVIENLVLKEVIL